MVGRYPGLGIFIVKSRNFKCSLSNAKCNFYRLESCQLSNGDLNSLDFTYNRMCIKLFKSSNIELIVEDELPT